MLKCTLCSGKKLVHQADVDNFVKLFSMDYKKFSLVHFVENPR